MGDVQGLTNLGWCFEAGVGVEADPKQAVVLYAQAAAREYVPALTNLGYCYTYGIGVEKDLAKALECFRKGAEQGFPRAQFLLAEAYRQGEGVEQSDVEAVKMCIRDRYPAGLRRPGLSHAGGQENAG